MVSAFCRFESSLRLAVTNLVAALQDEYEEHKTGVTVNGDDKRRSIGLISPQLWFFAKIILVICVGLGVYSIVLTAHIICGKADLASKKTASSKNALTCALLVGSGAVATTARFVSSHQYSLLCASGLLWIYLLPYIAAHFRARQLSKR